MNRILKKINKLELLRFIRFCIVGVSNTAVSYVTYLAIIYCGGHYVAANIVGYITGTINAFVWNNNWVFRNGNKELKSIVSSFGRMVLSYAGTGIVLNNLLLIIWVRFFSIPKEIAPLINVFITMVINYLVNKIWVFNNTSKEKK